MTKIIITGYKGRMGRALLNCVPNHPNITVVGQVDIGDSIEAVLGQADVVVDFSSPRATLGLVEWCAGAGKAMVIGTTGHNPPLQDRTEFHNYAKSIPIVLASNFSVGVNTLFYLVRQAAKLLGPGFDLEIIEMHHRLKKDAPSGTANRLAQILSMIRNQQFSGSTVYPRQRGLKVHTTPGREGNTTMRDCNEIGIHSVRGGDVVGDHTVIFAGDGERVELTHKASSRETFANGALLAVKWVVGEAPGLYSMEDVLRLE